MVTKLERIYEATDSQYWCLRIYRLAGVVVLTQFTYISDTLHRHPLLTQAQEQNGPSPKKHDRLNA